MAGPLVTQGAVALFNTFIKEPFLSPLTNDFLLPVGLGGASAIVGETILTPLDVFGWFYNQFVINLLEGVGVLFSLSGVGINFFLIIKTLFKIIFVPIDHLLNSNNVVTAFNELQATINDG